MPWRASKFQRSNEYFVLALLTCLLLNLLAYRDNPLRCGLNPRKSRKIAATRVFLVSISSASAVSAALNTPQVRRCLLALEACIVNLSGPMNPQAPPVNGPLPDPRMCYTTSPDSASRLTPSIRRSALHWNRCMIVPSTNYNMIARTLSVDVALFVYTNMHTLRQ